MTRINAKATPINNNDYSCHITAVELVNQSYEVDIMPLVINNLGRGHTHTRTHTRTRIPTISTGSILRNQARAGLHAPGLISVDLKQAIFDTVISLPL